MKANHLKVYSNAKLISYSDVLYQYKIFLKHSFSHLNLNKKVVNSL